MAKEPYSVFDDDKLYQKPERRQWNTTTGSGWGRILSGPDKGHWQYWHEGKKVPDKIDRSGRMDLFNFSGTGWGKGKSKPTPIPTKKEEPTDFDGGYGDNLEFTMGFNPDSEPIIKGLTDGFTGNLAPLDGYYDETDTTNILNLIGIGNSDLVSRETGNKGGFWDKLSNSFSQPDPNLEDVPSPPTDLTSPDIKDQEFDNFNKNNYNTIVNKESNKDSNNIKSEQTTPEPLKLRSAKDYEKAVNEGKWEKMSRWDRQQAEIFAKGSPRKRMQISRARGTDVKDLFKKNIEDE